MKLKTLVLATAALFAANTMAEVEATTTQGEIQFNASFVESICTVTVNDTNILGADGTTIGVEQIEMGAYTIAPLNEAVGTNTASTPFTINFTDCPPSGTVNYGLSGSEAPDTDGKLFGVGGTTNSANLGLYIASAAVTAGTAAPTYVANNGTAITTPKLTLTDGEGSVTLYAGYQSVTETVVAEPNSVTTVTLNVIY